MLKIKGKSIFFQQMTLDRLKMNKKKKKNARNDI